MSKVLILEDERNLAELLKDLLIIEGYEVLIPSAFENVLQNVADFSPDALVTDVHLGEIDGLQIMRELRQDPANKSLYILALSGINLSHEAKEAGANAFLQKPFMPDEIINQLKGNIRS